MLSPLSLVPIALPSVYICGVNVAVALKRVQQTTVISQPPRDAALKALTRLHRCIGADGVKECLDAGNDRHRRTHLVHCLKYMLFELMQSIYRKDIIAII